MKENQSRPKGRGIDPRKIKRKANCEKFYHVALVAGEGGKVRLFKQLS
jgi:hypothetical protein